MDGKVIEWFRVCLVDCSREECVVKIESRVEEDGVICGFLFFIFIIRTIFNYVFLKGIWSF